MFARSLFSTALVAFLVAPSMTRAADSASSPASSEDPNARLRTLFRQAYAAYNAKNYEDSRNLLLQAWSLRQTYDVASALAQSEMKLEQYREAATHLQFCLDNVAPSTSEKTLEAIKQTFDEAKHHVATLHIVTSEGATISLDGQSLGLAPLSAPVFVEPGKHELLFVRGEDSAAKSIEIVAGADEMLEVPVEHVDPPPAPKPMPVSPKVQPAAPPPVYRDPRLEGIVVPAIVDGAAFAVGLTMAVGFRLAANSNDSHAEQLRKQVGPSGCASGALPSAACADLMDTAQSKDRNRSWSTVGMVVSVAALAAIPVYWYWPRPHDARASAGALRLGGAFSPGYTALSLGANF